MLAKELTPLFNIPDPGKELGGISGDEIPWVRGHWRALECCLLPGMQVTVEKVLPGQMCQVTTPFYSSRLPLYTHQDFLIPSFSGSSMSTFPPLPSIGEFLKKVHHCLDRSIPYVWGGNDPEGTQKLHQLYPSRSPLDQLPRQARATWTLSGVDCSGLIFWATGGATPRNSSELMHVGMAVRVEGCSAQEIAEQVLPGMLIVWPGHVLVVTDRGIVDSAAERGGVGVSSAVDKLDQIMQTRTPRNHYHEGKASCEFVVRDLYFQERI